MECYTTFFECGALVEIVSNSKENAQLDAEDLHFESCSCSPTHTAIGSKTYFIDDYSHFHKVQ